MAKAGKYNGHVGQRKWRKPHAITNQFGDYRFGGVSVGQSYTIGVQSERFIFATQTISVENEMVNINLFARH